MKEEATCGNCHWKKGDGWCSKVWEFMKDDKREACDKHVFTGIHNGSEG